MRWYKDSRVVNTNLQDPKYQCCFCCHVRTGTLMLGIYNLATQLICMCVLMFAIVHPELLVDQLHGRLIGPASLSTDIDIGKTSAIGFDGTPKAVSSESGSDEPEMPQWAELEKLPTPLPLKETGGVVDEFPNGRNNGLPVKFPQFDRSDMVVFTRNRLESGDLHLAVVLVFGLFVITNMMIFGVLRGRPWYLLPFFCFQVFDFILSCLTAVGHYAWLPNIRDVLDNNPGVPMRSRLVGVNSQWLAVIILLAYVLVLFVKSYFIGVVWSCYQYLHARNLLTLAYAESSSEPLLLPPDYDTATKMAPPSEGDFPPIYSQPPPGYTPA